eukprot:CAMPEP_0194048652 /NCGR_PEP_ID=MMETSP0009_2-20130614/28009_1 /TAXON_ID=210454 /ORGANISM="Grammatophora oceanica, Strain CCMP 410" /LENGTH=436 /DNA_ID=CAMNT_0038694581 /DNA_START=115 /DNA_END=1425 /DNA_ORIENTATION=+
MAEMKEIGDVWTDAQLMGKEPVEGYKVDPDKNGKDGKIKPQYWGIPGYLTQEEVVVYNKFKAEVDRLGGDVKKTVYCFGEEEGEAWCLCRWLRARKFVYEDVVIMINEATKTCAVARTKDFYPDPKEALGCDMSLYFVQFPQLYSGHAKNGAPLFISKPGVLNVDAVECITTLEGILKFHWYIMVRDFGDRLREQKKLDPDAFKQFSCVCVLDLAGLTTSQLSSRALAIIKEQSAIDSVCFPETMNRMVIVNAPRFFTATWGIIKGWLDARTASKIDVISSRKAWEAKLLEFVDKDQLPMDYGGTGVDTKQTLAQSQPEGMIKLTTEVMKIRSYGSITHDIAAGMALEITVWTRSVAGADFTITDTSKDKSSTPPLVSKLLVKHTGSDDVNSIPTSGLITKERLVGPLSIKIKGECHAGRFTTNNFCLAFAIYPAS